MTDYCYTEIMKEILLAIGLTEKEATIYLFLLSSPHQSAKQVAEAVKLKRPNAYRLLSDLTEQNLVTYTEESIRRFSVTEPLILQKIIQEKQSLLQQTTSSLATIMPSFRSQYALALNKPGVIHAAGREGFERLLIDMIDSKTEVLLIASSDQPSDAAVLQKFQELIAQRKENNVPTRAIFHDGSHHERIQKKFIDRGFDVRFIGNTPFKGEVIIYEDTLAFTVYDPSLITTIITNASIASTMRILFEEVWSKANA